MCLLQILLIECILLRINALNGLSPRISPLPPDFTVLSSVNVKFTCESDEPIYWQFPEQFMKNKNEYYIQNSLDPSRESPYKSVLELNQVDYTYVGYYYCVKNATVIDTGSEALYAKGQAEKIYLFVKDPEHPVAFVSFKYFIGNLYDNILIPCKPTSKEYDVILINKANEKLKFESTFDPREGYQIKLNEKFHGGIYICRAKNKLTNRINEEFHIRVLSEENYPLIEPRTQNYGIEGGSLELNCSASIKLTNNFTMTWNLPNNNTSKVEGRAMILEPVRINGTHPELLRFVGQLIITELDKVKDTGIYSCLVTVSDGQSVLSRYADKINILKIVDVDESFINITEPFGQYKLIVKSNEEEVRFLAKYTGYPIPKIVWHNSHDHPIPWSLSEDENRKYEAIKVHQWTFLRIRHPKLEDSGNYTLYGNNDQLKVQKQFQLLVRGKPQLRMIDVWSMPGESAVMTCDIFEYPPSFVTWSFIPCNCPVLVDSNCNSCDDSKKREYDEYQSKSVRTIKLSTLNRTSKFTFTPISTGIVICEARNSQGRSETRAKIILNDLNETLSVWSAYTLPILVGDDISIICGASNQKYSSELNWYKDNIRIVNADKMTIIAQDTQFSYRREIRWKSIDEAASGRYVCKANAIGGTEDWKMLELNVVKPQQPEVKSNYGESIKLTCRFKGVPQSKITWFKDGIEIRSDVNDKRRTFDDHGTIFNFHYTLSEDEGKYTCVGKNELESIKRDITLTIIKDTSATVAIIISVSAVILILIICTIYLCIKIRRERRLSSELKAAGLANFEEGNPESINPDLALDEQADLLPYDKRYEFPKEKIKLGKQIGAGAFGVVVKGLAQGIVPYEAETTVAIKMVKRMANNEVMRALITELKIMVHLGQHLNVVNLLGAVTEKIIQREAMIIVEYCQFGNLQSFLVKHRRFFINQIVRDQGQEIIDTTIQTSNQRRSNDTAVRNSEAENSNPEASLASGGDNIQSDAHPGWGSNCQSDSNGISRSFTSSDLICWAFQVARGMHYLASRKVLHGDLAARNILLCNDNVVKVCDFGLARSMYKTDNYRKKGEGPLPFKWLALESISDQMFSTYSDVWSFGIVLWELFSLGRVPYPGMDADQALYLKLRDGYRMEKPDYATNDIYDIMLSCWRVHPESRPLFNNLENSLSQMMGSGVVEHYIDLNEPYLKSNVNNSENYQTDYVALMTTPEYQAPRKQNTYINCDMIEMKSTSNMPCKSDHLEMSQSIYVNSAQSEEVDTHDSQL